MLKKDKRHSTIMNKNRVDFPQIRTKQTGMEHDNC